MARKWIKSYWYLVGIVGLTILAATIRLWQLGQVPQGLTWDEAAIAYDGFGVVTVRRDQWLHFLPISFRSFGDYKAPVAVYLTGLFVTVLGSQAWVIRLPFALGSIVGVVGFILLVEQLLQRWSKSNHNWTSPRALALVAGLLITLSPWHVHFSRLGFESGLALTIIMWGNYFLLVATRRHLVQGKWLILAGLLFTGAIYTYHSSKILLPLWALVVLLTLHRQLFSTKQQWRWSILTSLVSSLALAPFIFDTFFAHGSERLTQASIFGLDHTWTEQLSIISGNFLSHFDLQYLAMGATSTLRHGDGQWGVLLPTTLLLVILGWWSIVSLRSSSKINWRLSLWAVAWIILGVLPAAIGRDVPHSNRSILALPGFLLLAVLGWKWAVESVAKLEINQKILGSHQEQNLVLKSVVGMSFLIHCLLFIAYQRHYYSVFAHTSVDDFKAGYMEVFKYVNTYIEDRGEPVSQIVFSNAYGQAYIYALLVNRYNPIQFNQGYLNRFLFVDHAKRGDLDRPNTLIVGTPLDIELPESGDVHQITTSDGQVRFRVFVSTDQ